MSPKTDLLNFSQNGEYELKGVTSIQKLTQNIKPLESSRSNGGSVERQLGQHSFRGQTPTNVNGTKKLQPGLAKDITDRLYLDSAQKQIRR